MVAEQHTCTLAVVDLAEQVFLAVVLGLVEVWLLYILNWNHSWLLYILNWYCHALLERNHALWLFDTL